MKLFLQKCGLAVISFLAFAFFMPWQLALIVMALLLIHEKGHVWAMKRAGDPQSGFYFIPLLGGVAISKNIVYPHWDRFLISFMGPAWGCAGAIVCAALYFATGEPLWAVAAYFGAIINLTNLIPLSPLDGGQMFQFIAFSIPFYGAMTIFAESVFVVSAGALLFYLDMPLTMLFAFFAILSMSGIYRRWQIINTDKGQTKLELEIYKKNRKLEMYGKTLCIFTEQVVASFEAEDIKRDYFLEAKAEFDLLTEKTEKEIKKLATNRKEHRMSRLELFRAIYFSIILTLALSVIGFWTYKPCYDYLFSAVN